MAWISAALGERSRRTGGGVLVMVTAGVAAAAAVLTRDHRMRAGGRRVGGGRNGRCDSSVDVDVSAGVHDTDAGCGAVSNASRPAGAGFRGASAGAGGLADVHEHRRETQLRLPGPVDRRAAARHRRVISRGRRCFERGGGGGGVPALRALRRNWRRMPRTRSLHGPRFGGAPAALQHVRIRHHHTPVHFPGAAGSRTTSPPPTASRAVRPGRRKVLHVLQRGQRSGRIAAVLLCGRLPGQCRGCRGERKPQGRQDFASLDAARAYMQTPEYLNAKRMITSLKINAG